MRAEMQQQQQAAAPAAPQTRRAADARSDLGDQIREAVRAAQEGAREGVRDGRTTREGLKTSDQFAERVRIAQEMRQAPPAAPTPPPPPGIMINGKTISIPQGIPRVNVDPDGRMTVVGSDGQTTIREPDGRVLMIDPAGNVTQATGVPSAREFIAPVRIDEDIIIPGMFFLTILFGLIGFPIARAIARRMDRRTHAVPPANAALPAEAAARLERIEQSVDAVAIEVERISEGQRFTTRLMSEMRGAADQRPQPVAQQPQLPPASLNETSFAQRAVVRPDPVGAPAPDDAGTGGRRGE